MSQLPLFSVTTEIEKTHLVLVVEQYLVDPPSLPVPDLAELGQGTGIVSEEWQTIQA